jgi:hypothetical protein
VEKGIWGELGSSGAIAPERRALQKMHLEKLIELSQTAKADNSVKTSDIPSAARMQLDDLEDRIEKAAKKNKDALSKAHLEDCLERIEALDKD